MKSFIAFLALVGVGSIAVSSLVTAYIVTAYLDRGTDWSQVEPVTVNLEALRKSLSEQ